LVAAMSLGLAACGGGGGSPTTAPVPTPVVAQPSATPPPATTTPAAGPAIGAWSVEPSLGPAPLGVTVRVCNGTPANQVSVSVDFGENGGRERPASGCQLTHTYNNQGQFTVTAYVTDSKGQEDKASQSVNVTAPATLKVQAKPNNCMVDISVDASSVSGRDVVGLAVAKVMVTLKRTSSQTVEAKPAGSSTWTTTQDMSKNGLNLGSGNLDVSAEAFDVNNKSLAKGTDNNKAVNCSS
jgi:hypothetical protein